MITLLSVAIIICAYIYIYLKPKEDFQILQSNLNNITDNVLYEKYPIIINDAVINAEDLLSTLFKYQYVFNKHVVLDENVDLINYTKFLVVHNKNSAVCYFDVSNPPMYSTKITLMLPPFNVMVLPYRWKLYNTNHKLHCIELNDLIHFFTNIYVH